MRTMRLNGDSTPIPINQSVPQNYLEMEHAKALRLHGNPKRFKRARDEATPSDELDGYRHTLPPKKRRTNSPPKIDDSLPSTIWIPTLNGVVEIILRYVYLDPILYDDNTTHLVNEKDSLETKRNHLMQNWFTYGRLASVSKCFYEILTGDKTGNGHRPLVDNIHHLFRLSCLSCTKLDERRNKLQNSLNQLTMLPLTMEQMYLERLYWFQMNEREVISMIASRKVTYSAKKSRKEYRKRMYTVHVQNM